MTARSVMVLPEDSPKPILDVIGAASTSIAVKMFVFSDSRLIEALIAAKHRGVDVRVMLNPERRSGERENEPTRRALARAGVEVKDANPAFDLTHEKSMVVDGATAFVNSLNWTQANLTDSRDYAVITRRARDVAEIAECFQADWERRPFAPAANSHLIWCPGPGRDRICEFIDQAKHRLFVQNPRYQDTVIIERLVRARQRGVKVHVMARPAHSLKREKLVEGVGGLRILDDLGVKVHKPTHLKLHGKMLLADGVAAIVGSINFAAGSLDGRRELAIEVRDDTVVDRLHEVAMRDWQHSHPMDLSDAGLIADLADRVDDGARLLALDEHPSRSRP
jgi:phosphatidylserine/phosphatidylglycerophosphate/cardiolipin synthase-like enzyme